MERREISRFLLGSLAGTALLSERAQAQTCVAPCYAQTADESAVGVTPTEPAYPPLDVRRYGVVGDGSDEHVAIQSALNVAAVSGGNVLFPVPSVAYNLGTAGCTVGEDVMIIG